MVAFSPKFYHLTKHGNLLINKRVAGFCVPTHTWQPGLFAQEICIDGQSHFFVYKLFKVPTFCFFTRKKLSSYLDRYKKDFEESLDIVPQDPNAVVGPLLVRTVRWVGMTKQAHGDYSRITTPGGTDIIYIADGGRPTLIPECQVFLRPLGYFLS